MPFQRLHKPGRKSTPDSTIYSWELNFPGGQSQTGFAGGESVTYMGDGIVIKTTDGGSTWSQLWTGTDQGIEGISFPDLNTGYICGWSAYFAKTTNGGVTWTPQTPGTDIYFYTDVDFKDATHGVVTAETNSGAGVYTTSDGGATWSTGSGVAGVPYGLCYVTDNTYYLVTSNGYIQRSTDGGLNWTTVYTGAGLLMGIDFFNSSIGMAAGEDGKIFKTYDGGSSWQSQTIAGGYPLWRDFGWYDQNTVYVCGTPEMIYKSTDGGSNWVDDYSQSTYDPALYEVMFTNDGTGYICGSQGWFYRLAPALAAAFTADDTSICEGGTVQFTDQSAGSPTSWSWTFEGGTPSTSALQNPVVSYSTPGVYDVALTVTKGFQNNSVQIQDYIQVDDIPEPVIAGNEYVCTEEVSYYSATEIQGNSYEWNVAGGIITEGQGTSGINVQWGSVTGTGTVELTERTESGCSGTSDVYNVSIEDCTGIGSVAVSSMLVYPNPAENSFSVHLGQALEEDAVLEISNTMGSNVKTMTIPSGTRAFSVTGLNGFFKGIYFVRLTQGNTVIYYSKLLKE